MSIIRLSVQEAAVRMLAGALYIDVRTEDEFAEGHPPNAVNVPYAHQGPDGMVTNANFVEEFRRVAPADSNFVLGCRSGNRSMRAGALLEAAGYTDIHELRPGWDGARDTFGQLSEPGWSRSQFSSES